ncbi:MAG: hypothetical protein ACK5GN_08760 [Pseudomonadota bacterium]|jgi:hypothetical protein
MKPATTIADNGTFSVQKSIFGPECITIRLKPQKSIFEFTLRARKITIPGALATQFHEISGLAADYSVLQKSVAKSRVLENAIDSRMRIKTTT